MEYRVVRTGQSDELEHAFSLFGKKKSSSSSGSGQQGAKKGSTWDKHKYIARQKTGDTWRYFYSQAELAAAKAKQTGQKAASAVGNAAKKGVANVKRSAADLKGYAGKVDSDRNRYKEALKKSSDMITSAHDRRTKAGDRVRGAEFGSTVSKKLADSLDAASKESMSKLKIFTAKKEKEAADSARKDANEYQRIRAEEFKKESNADKAEARAISNYLDIKNKAEAYEDNVNKVKYGLSTALNKADKAIDKGKSAASKFLSNAKSITSDAVDKGKEFAKKAGLAVSDTASKAVGAVATQIDLTKNAKREASAQINMNADAKQKKAALDEANEKLALIRKDRKENPYKHTEGVWDLHEEIARDKIRKAQYQYNLADTVATQYEPEGKTSYDWFDSDVGGRKIERTSEQRQNDIKLQNRYKYDREYREQIDSERAAAVKKYEQLTAQFETLYNKESEAEKKYGRNSDEYKALNKKTMDLLYKVGDARDDVFYYDVIRAKTMK